MPNLKLSQYPVVTPTGSDHVPGIQGGQNKRFTIQSILDLFSGGGAGTGDVVGPPVAVDGNFASYDTTTGKLIKDSLYSPSSFDASGAATTAEANAKAYADGLVVGLLDDRGSYDASVNTFPVSGGSGTVGAIVKGDIWYISVAGTLGGVAVNIGDSVRALVDSPGQTAGSWSILESNIGYVPENTTNKATTMSGNTTSNIVFLTAKAIYDWGIALFAPIASPTFTGLATFNTIKITGGSPGAGKVATSDADGDVTWETPSGGGSQCEPLQDYQGTAFIGVLGTKDLTTSGTILEVTAICDTLPVGSNLIIELRRNSTTSPDILSDVCQVTTTESETNGRYVGVPVTNISSPTFTAGEVLYAYITSVGSTTPAINARLVLRTS